jgi:hypothetical protein
MAPSKLTEPVELELGRQLGGRPSGKSGWGFLREGRGATKGGRVAGALASLLESIIEHVLFEVNRSKFSAIWASIADFTAAVGEEGAESFGHVEEGENWASSRRSSSASSGVGKSPLRASSSPVSSRMSSILEGEGEEEEREVIAVKNFLLDFLRESRSW